jgi:hypothetical protein
LTRKSPVCWLSRSSSAWKSQARPTCKIEIAHRRKQSVAIVSWPAELQPKTCERSSLLLRLIYVVKPVEHSLTRVAAPIRIESPSAYVGVLLCVPRFDFCQPFVYSSSDVHVYTHPDKSMLASAFIGSSFHIISYTLTSTHLWAPALFNSIVIINAQYL